jgi:hypothetical protein
MAMTIFIPVTPPISQGCSLATQNARAVAMQHAATQHGALYVSVV